MLLHKWITKSLAVIHIHCLWSLWLNTLCMRRRPTFSYWDPYILTNYLWRTWHFHSISSRYHISSHSQAKKSNWNYKKVTFITVFGTTIYKLCLLCTFNIPEIVTPYDKNVMFQRELIMGWINLTVFYFLFCNVMWRLCDYDFTYLTEYLLHICISRISILSPPLKVAQLNNF